MAKLSKKKKVKQPSPILIKYEMVSAQQYLPYIAAARYSYSKNLAALRQIYSGSGASMLFCGSSVARNWTVSFTTNAVDIETGVVNQGPHFISLKVKERCKDSTAIICASKVWYEHVKPELENMNMREVSVDVVLKAIA